jgi:hypothetical protein
MKQLPSIRSASNLMTKESWWLSLFLIVALGYVFAYSAHAEKKCRTLINNKAPRGMLCLQCLSKRAPSGATPFVSLLQESCLKRIALGFVTDGTFGFDEARLIEAVQGLAEGGRKGSIHLYIYNGPAQRRWQSGVFKSFAVMDPFLFRHKILEDVTTQEELRKSVARLSNVLTYAASLKVSISIAPGLEDNLGDESFAKALTIIKETIPSDVSVRWVRSSCTRCAIGNDTTVPKGVAREIHTRGTDFSFQRGIVSNDGDHVRFSFETTTSSTGVLLPKVSDLRPALKKASQLENTFLLWIPKYQDSPYGVVPYSPEIRTFRKPSLREKNEILALLKS